MNRSRWMTLVGVVLAIAVGSWFIKGRATKDVPKYRTAQLERGDISSTVSATGSLRPVVQVEVGSQVSGTILRLHADYNTRVKAGELLAEIEPSSFQTRVVQAQAGVARAQAALDEATRAFDRGQALLKGDFISQADLDGLGSQVAQHKADLQQARALLQSAQVDLNNTRIRSPIDGVVISRAIDVGQTVAASLQAPKLFVIANDLAQMQVETRIDEADIGRIRAGLPVTFTVDAFQDATFSGVVSQVRLEPIVDQNVVTYTTVIRTRNDDLRLRPGMTANVTVLVETKKSVLKAPNAALRFRPAGVPVGRDTGALGGGAPGGRTPGGRAGGALTGSGTANAATLPVAGAGAPGARAGRWSGPRGGQVVAGADEATPMKPGVLWVLKDGKPSAIAVMKGVSDGAATEVVGDPLAEGMSVIIGLEVTAPKGAALAPPPGMGGPQLRGGGRGR